MRRVISRGKAFGLMAAFYVDDVESNLLSGEDKLSESGMQRYKDTQLNGELIGLSVSLTTQYENSPFTSEVMVKPDGRLVRVS
jgi:hypothetical protein